jgi:hypothetical protein
MALQLKKHMPKKAVGELSAINNEPDCGDIAMKCKAHKGRTCDDPGGDQNENENAKAKDTKALSSLRITTSQVELFDMFNSFVSMTDRSV